MASRTVNITCLFTSAVPTPVCDEQSRHLPTQDIRELEIVVWWFPSCGSPEQPIESVVNCSRQYQSLEKLVLTYNVIVGQGNELMARHNADLVKSSLQMRYWPPQFSCRGILVPQSLYMGTSPSVQPRPGDGTESSLQTESPGSVTEQAIPQHACARCGVTIYTGDTSNLALGNGAYSLLCWTHMNESPETTQRRENLFRLLNPSLPRSQGCN